MARSFPQKQITAKEAEAQAQQFLYQCRPEALAGVTVLDMVHRYRGLGERKAEYLLTIARQKRAAELA